MQFIDFFRNISSLGDPYPYQERLAVNPWPDLLDVPTGLGKTAAVILAWLYKRLSKDPETPRRLIYCLPMRVLVEQTRSNADAWVSASKPLFQERHVPVPRTYTMLGGEAQTEWVRDPAHPAIIIGTQDMLLSRALMRGYGMSRYQWPIHFAFLHNDALWVYDEVQLMGPALATSAQLEAFRSEQRHSPGRGSRSLWTSATLRPDWLATVDFRGRANALARLALSNEERREPAVARRINAAKRLERAASTLNNETSKKKAQAYIEALAKEINSAHAPNGQTLVIVNRVERAQGLYEKLGKVSDAHRLLLHARFRPYERQSIEKSLRDPSADTGRIVIATQAVEAGVDISSRVLFTELAPWSSLVQRFGRCNRAGEHERADVRWIDITDDADEAAPYSAEVLNEARQHLLRLDNASPAALPAIDEQPPAGQVIRRRDFLALFNTDSDLSGFDIDVSPYIRDTGIPQLQVFWRELDDHPGEEPAPSREELCPASLVQVRDFFDRTRRAWSWDTLAERWLEVERTSLRPGMTLLLRARDGGYDKALGFTPMAKQPVSVLRRESEPMEAFQGDELTMTQWTQLGGHLADAAEEANSLCRSLAEDAGSIATAALWHDIGKAHPAFQNALAKVAEPPKPDMLWAKSSGRGRLVYGLYEGQKFKRRPFFRHELVSALAWLEHNDGYPDRDLIAYLIGAHHGKVRMGLRALPREAEPDDSERLFARGVWAGDELPEVRLNGKTLPPTVLRLDLMRLGDGPQGPSWATRTARLLDELGPFRLAWLEALVRIADWRASAQSDSCCRGSTRQ